MISELSKVDAQKHLIKIILANRKVWFSRIEELKFKQEYMPSTHRFTIITPLYKRLPS